MLRIGRGAGVAQCTGAPASPAQPVLVPQAPWWGVRDAVPGNSYWLFFCWILIGFRFFCILIGFKGNLINY